MTKEQKTKEAVETRHEIDKERLQQDDQNLPVEERFAEGEGLENLKEAGAQMAEAKPQSVHGTTEGIDLEARGDVKGDGGDAKDYDDGDPDKYKSPPTYEYGLHETKAGENTALPRETRISDRTLAEQDRGAQVADGHRAARERAVTDEAKEAKAEAKSTKK